MSENGAEFRRGWPVLVASAFGNLSALYSVLYFGLSSLMKPLQAEFGWTRPQISLVVIFMTLSVVLASPWVGRACDRYGSRAVVLTSVPLSALAIAALSQLGGALWLFYAGYLLAMLLGSGTLGLAYISGITARFDRHRGLAFGFAFSGAGVAAFVLPLLLTPVIEAWGWRQAFLILAVLPLLQWPLAYALLPRNTPGRKSVPDHEAAPLSGVLFSQAIRGRRFWILAITFFLLGLALAGLIVNLVALLTDRGLSEKTAAEVTSVLGIGIVFARIFAGWLVDHLPARHVASAGFFGAALGCACLYTSDPLVAGLGTLLIGLAIGSEMDLLAYMTTRYFGLKEQGLMFGALFSVFTGGGICSPMLIGGLYAVAGSYDVVLGVSIAACVLAAILVNLMGPYPSSVDLFHRKQLLPASSSLS